MNRTVGRHRARIATVLGLVCAIGVVATPALAVKGDKLRATVDGKKVTFRNKLVCGGYTIAAFSVTGATKNPFHVIRSMQVGCDVDLTTAALPISPSICTIFYQETRLLHHPFSKAWSSISTPDNPVIQVTISSFSGGRLEGTFSGTLASETAGTPATTVHGTFSATAVLNNNTCTPAPPAV
ncbi:MAG TPA: hypothetical protein VKU61_00635 [Candidatus Binatia bacterium]|nr:hypothetical protein [Candidatus Binatia bacterium]